MLDLFCFLCQSLLLIYSVCDSSVLAETSDELMESKGGKKKKSSNSGSSLQYEAPLGYSIEDVRPHGGIKKFQSAAYSNVRTIKKQNHEEGGTHFSF